ncbi:MAG: PD-(D/E)XK nuclease family protein, partial [Elusimicrobia bacterium]|nr:PD-(D/E)XK nuclease family protein [Elusimicrobiota bacterium]
HSTFGKFYPWGKEIRAFIDHLDIEAVPAEKLKGVSRSAEIGYDLPKDINELLISIAEIKNAFQEFMEKEKKYSKGYLYKKAAQEIKNIPLEEFDHIFFCNLFYLHKTEKGILKHLYNTKKGKFFFQGNNTDWPQLKSLAKDLGCTINSPSPSPLSSPLNGEDKRELRQEREPNIHVYSAQDTHAQCSLAREIVSKISDREKAVLVIPDSDAVMPALAELSNELTDFNVSLGYPLSRTGVFSLLDDIKNAQSSKNDKGYYAKDFIGVLKNPLVKNLKLLDNPSITRVLVHKIEEALIGENDEANIAGTLFVNFDDIVKDKSIFQELASSLDSMGIPAEQSKLIEVFEELYKFGFKMWEQIDSFGSFVSSVRVLVEKLLSDNYFSTYQLNIRAMDRLLNIIEEFEGSSFLNEKFDKDEIFKIFEQRLSSEMVSFTGSPLKGFQILGPLEVRSLNFETVIIMDMNESVMPNLKIQEALIPRDIMIDLGLTRIEKEEEIQRYHFSGLISGAKEAHLIYCDSDKFERSRFLERIIWEKQKKANSIEPLSVFEPKFNFKISPEKKEKQKTKEIVKYLLEYPYSPTSVNTYISCPMKFYFQYVFGLKEKDDVAEEVERVDVGNFIHKFLENILGGFIGKPYVLDESFRKLFFSELDKKFSKEFERKMKSDIFLLKEVVKIAMNRFLKNEVSRVSEIEAILGIEKNLKGTYNNRKFDIKIDRIDSLKDSTCVILDYKTGNVIKSASLKTLEKTASDMSRETIKKAVKSLQLPIYMYFVSQTQKIDMQKLNAGLYDLKKGKIELFYKDEDSSERKQKFDICMKSLDFILNEITDESAPFKADDADSRQCQQCPFYYNCR